MKKLTFTLTDEQWARLTEIVKEENESGREVTTADVVLEALEIKLRFDGWFMKTMKKFSEDIKVPLWLIIQNWCIQKLATKEARAKVWMAPVQVMNNLLREFKYEGVKGSSEPPEPLTGKRLFNNIMDNKMKDLIRLRCEEIQKHTPTGGPLFDQDRIFLEEFESRISKKLFRHIMESFGSQSFDDI